MGEKITDLATGDVLGARLEIELNHPNVEGQQRQVHLQSSGFRFELSQGEYIKCALVVLEAARNLKQLKNIQDG
jgi:hypothetical protein